MTAGGADRRVSMLFDVFVLNQRLRALLSRALSESELKADEYAVYSVLFEHGSLTATQMAGLTAMPVTTMLDYVRTMTARGHVRRTRNPADLRSYLLSLTPDGLATHRRTGAAWNVAVARLEGALSKPVAEVRDALQALDDAAAQAIAGYDADQRADAG
jgi:DNA-binding MarR family transcriptional regulator